MYVCTLYCPGIIDTYFLLVISVANKIRTMTLGEVKGSFASLVQHISSKLCQKELDFKNFRLYLANMFPLQSVPNVDDVSIIFQDLSAQEMWDYYNFEILEEIANHFLPEDKDDLTLAIENHAEKVSNYLAGQRIADYIEMELPHKFNTLEASVPSCGHSGKPYCYSLSLKLDVKIEEETLEYIHKLWRKLKRVFGVPECTALLDHIHNGCIVVVWLIPPSASEVIKKPQPWSAISFLQQHFIIRIELNESQCIYDKQVS